MKKIFIILILLQLSIIQISSEQSFIQQYSELSSACPCDLMKNECDPYCCCDSNCGNLATIWNENKECVNIKYPKLLTIPICDSQTSHNIQDLYRVFRVVYNVFRSVMCLNTINLSQSNLEPTFTQYDLIDEETKKIEDKQLYILDSQNIGSQKNITDQQNSRTNFYEQHNMKYQVGSSFQDLKLNLPTKNSFQCREQNIYLFENVPNQQCRYTWVNPAVIPSFLDFGTYFDNTSKASLFRLSNKKNGSFTEAQSQLNALATVTGIFRVNNDGLVNNVNEISVNNNGQNVYASNDYRTTCTLSGNVYNCKNVVVQKHFIISMDTSSNIQDNTSLVVYLQDLTITANQKINISNSVQFHNSSGEIGYKNSGSTGYLLGLPLRFGRLVKIDDVQGIQEFVSPLQLGHMDNQGNCVNSNIAETDLQESYIGSYYTNTLFDVKFGYNSMIQCDYTPSTNQSYCDLSIFKYLEFYIENVAQYGNSNPNDIDTWIKMDGKQWCSQNQHTVVTIKYTQFGQKTNTVNIINDITISFVDVRGYETNEKRPVKVFFSFEEQFLETVEYKAPPPKFNFYFPDDILYPFYVAKAESNILQYTQTLVLFVLISIFI